jgi:hypothetical protein
MTTTRPELSVILWLIAIGALGCSHQDDSESAAFEFSAIPVGESATETVVLNHLGFDWQQFSRFDIALTDESQLDWHKIDAASGETIGPPKIAGFYRGRKVFPTVLELSPGEAVVLQLNYTPQGSDPPSGTIAFTSTDHWCSRFILGVRSRP